MTNTPAKTTTITDDYGERMSAAIGDYVSASKDYQSSEKNAFNAAKTCLGKATSFEERKYWYEKMEQHGYALRIHKVETAAIVTCVVLVGVLYACK